MTADQFAYWLQGFTELHGEPPTVEQWAAIKDHLKLVFTKVTPVRDPYPFGPIPQPFTTYPPMVLKPGQPWPATTTTC